MMSAVERSAARTHAARTTKLDAFEIRATRAFSRFADSPAAAIATAAALVVLGSINDFPMP